MKKLFFIVLAIVFTGCNNESSEIQKTEETLSISPTGKLEFLLSKAIPVEGGYSISQQPEHHDISEIQYQDEGIFYVYTPEKGFIGTDIVKIKREDSDGARIYAETIITLNIEVTE